MSKSGKKKEDDLVKLVAETLKRYPELRQKIPEGTALNRIQPREHDDNPVFYNRNSDTRYADPDHETGVYYVGLSPEVTVAEALQPGQGVDDQVVALKDFNNSTMHDLVAAGELNVVDVVGLANRSTNQKLRDLVMAKGQGREGYAPTQSLSKACMKAGAEIDGLIYPSSVYTVAGSLKGCNLVLFENRGVQVKPVSHEPLRGVQLSNGETPLEFLDSLGVALE